MNYNKIYNKNLNTTLPIFFKTTSQFFCNLFGTESLFFLNQLMYWVKKCGREIKGKEGKWIYNSLPSWQKQFPFLSMYKIRKIIKSLEDFDLIISAKVNANKWNHTKWYTINYDKYNSLLEEANVINYNKDSRYSTNDSIYKTQDYSSINNASFCNATSSNSKDCEIIKSIDKSNPFIKSSQKEDSSSKELIKTNKSNFVNNEQKEKATNPVSYSFSPFESVKNCGKVIKEEDNTKQNVVMSKTTKNISTDRSVENQHIIITKNNYTKKSSYKKKNKNLNSQKKQTEEKIFTNILKKEDSRASKQLQDSEKGNQEIIKTMIYLWNKVFDYSVSPIKAYKTKKIEKTLLNLYKNIFNSDLDKWREYALKVNSSKFLMGEKETKNNFKAVFPWLIKEETVQAIESGSYGVGDRELDIEKKTENTEEKKKELIAKLEKKLTTCLKEEVEEKEEIKQFEEYIKKRKYREDGDKYKITKYVEMISPEALLADERYEAIKRNIYDSYITGKHGKITKQQMREKIKEKIRCLEERVEKEELFKELGKLTNQVDLMTINKDNSKNSAIGIESLISKELR